ncbi:MAG TPA: hypothetical protein VFA54_11465 [Bryobacterales bacterium]|jgi:hypothetical protein|nr:hypothetical protein [Bryobacterales bacterium]
MTCAICHRRKAKRDCPAVRSAICPQCCGREREETLDCPLDCPYLMESREHEKRPGLDPENFPYKEIRISDTYLRQNEELLTALGEFVLAAALNTPGAADRDVRDALDALARTYKTLESGVYYETEPRSPVAQAIARYIQEALRAFRKEETQRTGMTRTRDADVLGILVFLLRMALDRDNGRKRGRSFIDFLRRHFGPADSSGRIELAGGRAVGSRASGEPSLIVPG